MSEVSVLSEIESMLGALSVRAADQGQTGLILSNAEGFIPEIISEFLQYFSFASEEDEKLFLIRLHRKLADLVGTNSMSHWWGELILREGCLVLIPKPAEKNESRERTKPRVCIIERSG